ncbi:GMP synthase [Metarhizium acridum CQMa 102]|uniref:GMP synthase [glutamine-hydrolyzing] n=1 Tax=Metarhizium acridum (strain CQMa 102) TaxID=655827 RepID=E9E7G2_METAQ|nr:GMP synthase [Metarhizium acridum CQMa 102]EFY88204.1 GMP synthase [Metarhizium acridum CQMa 102]
MASRFWSLPLPVTQGRPRLWPGPHSPAYKCQLCEYHQLARYAAEITITIASTIEAEVPHSNFDTILVLDFGSQTSHLILRRLRALGVFAELLSCTTKVAELPWKPKGNIFSGGVKSLDVCFRLPNVPLHVLICVDVDPAVFELDVPILGIWYGLLQHPSIHAMTLTSLTPAMVARRSLGESTQKMLFAERHEQDFVVIAATKKSEFAGIAHEEKPIFGVQFHPELEHTPRGSDILFNFSVDICGARPNWKMGNFVELEIARIGDLLGPKALVIGGVSGGVDSTVGATLMREAIGDRFIATGINNGCMRRNEFEEVKKNLSDHLGINPTVVVAGELFLSRLAGVSDPEKKRKIIGSTIEKEAENTPDSGKVEWFLQGTLYPDVISVSSQTLSDNQEKRKVGASAAHHNTGCLPERVANDEWPRLTSIEPLRLLFRDEVRAIGRQLGIHESLVNRHPFPGPEIAIRILGDVTKERVEIARKADNIFINMIKEAGLYDQMSQAFASLDTSRSVGVFGDVRVWGYIVILRAVRTKDFMSAEVFNFDNSFLQDVSRAICNQVDGVSRVVYDLTSDSPGSMELEQAA